jgi:hypothetical protein
VCVCVCARADMVVRASEDRGMGDTFAAAVVARQHRRWLGEFSEVPNFDDLIKPSRHELVKSIGVKRYRVDTPVVSTLDLCAVRACVRACVCVCVCARACVRVYVIVLCIICCVPVLSLSPCGYQTP